MKRLELVRLRVCKKCGRGGAELRTDDGQSMVVAIDPMRTRELRGDGPIEEEIESLLDAIVAGLERDGGRPQEVVLDLSDGHIRGLLSRRRGDEHDVIACTAEEGVALAIRGRLALYATEEALKHAAARGHPDHRGGPGGPDTLH